MKESGQKEVYLPKVSSRTWSAALDFIYGEEVNISTASVLELLGCADFYQLKKMSRL